VQIVTDGKTNQIVNDLQAYKYVWPGSSVGIATGYGLDGPGIESRWRRDFWHTSILAL
jgi:hypothetical protein